MEKQTADKVSILVLGKKKKTHSPFTVRVEIIRVHAPHFRDRRKTNRIFFFESSTHPLLSS